ncbi:hypothetical protein [Mesorhizobium abyssinicae]|uniref:hypothetical protein n=1 Tax=Mesorhizobium abyssinicae TaxID=1209958 RepID=UPI003CF201F8
MRVVPISLGAASILKTSMSSASGTGAPVALDRASWAISVISHSDVATSNSAESSGQKSQRASRKIAATARDHGIGHGDAQC